MGKNPVVTVDEISPFDQTLRQDEAHQARSQEKSLEGEGAPGEALGYTLRHRLGRGSYGEVWLAVDEETGREVAIKFFTRHRGLDFSLLKHEAGKLLQVVQERRIVQLLGVGWDADPPYYVMEHLPGGSLADRLQGEAMPVDEALPVFHDVTRALGYLHGKAVVHCDLKPGNVLLDEQGEIRLADFGQARLAGERVSSVGTLFYMAPEQCEPGSRPDVRSDIYSLGALLYALLTGRPPHATEEASRDLQSTGTHSERLARYRQILEQAPSPLRETDLPQLDPDLRKILDRCLATDPERRFQSVDQVLDALRARERWRTQRLVLAAGILGPLLLMLTLGALGLWAWSQTSEQVERQMVGLALETNLATARAMADTVDRNLSAFVRRVEREAQRGWFGRLVRDLESSSEDERPENERRLRDYMERLYAQYQDRFFYSWVVADREAFIQARAPHDERVLGRSYGYREWFSGRPERAPDEVTETPPPRNEPGITRTFVSTAEGSPRLMSVSSPIPYAEDPSPEPSSSLAESDEREEPPPAIGVLMATVLVDTFEDWLAVADSAASRAGPDVDPHVDPHAGPCPDRFAVLVNAHGQVVRHPCLPGELALPLPGGSFAEVEEVASMIADAAAASGGITTEAFADPLRDGKRYLAAASALEVNEGWTIFVLQDPDDALEPFFELRGFVITLASVAALVALAVLALLGYLLFRTLRAVRV